MNAQAVQSPLIFSKIVAVMRSLSAVAKSNKNQQQQYNFRGIDDVYNELHQHLAEHGVFTIPEILEERSEERTTKSGAAMVYRILKIRYTFYAEDGSSVSATVIGEGMDSGDKASNKAMSVAHKYAFIKVLCIPTKEPKDPEHDSHEIKPRGAAQAPRPAQATQRAGTSTQAEADATRLEEIEGAIVDLGFDVKEVLSKLPEPYAALNRSKDPKAQFASMDAESRARIIKFMSSALGVYRARAQKAAAAH